ncbi:hypothetical protein Hanom_Chr14g01302771 [Helianthus anomalus]
MGESGCMGNSNVHFSPVSEDLVQGRKAVGYNGGEHNDVEREIVGPEDQLSNGGSPVLVPNSCSPRPSYITLRPKNISQKERARKEPIPDLNEGAMDSCSSDPFGIEEIFRLVKERIVSGVAENSLVQEISRIQEEMP